MSIYVATSNDLQQVNKSNKKGKDPHCANHQGSIGGDALTHVAIGFGVGPCVAGPSVGARVGGIGAWQLLHLAFISLQ